MTDICAGCEGDETCQIQDDMRSSKYGCLIPQRFKELKEDIREIIKNTPGGVLKDDHTPKNFVKVDTFMRYYRAICEISGIVGSQSSTETPQ